MWLQQFAWTEAQKPKRLAERTEKIPRDPVSAASLDQEPMFCFETALKALYWSTLVYRYDENAPDLTRDPPLLVRAASLQLLLIFFLAAVQAFLGFQRLQKIKKGYMASADRCLHPAGCLPLPGILGIASRQAKAVCGSAACQLLRLMGDVAGGRGDYSTFPGVQGDEAVRQPRYTPQQGLGMFGMRQVQLFWERSLDTKVLIGWSEGAIVISFRGTASFRNAISDLQVCSTSPLPPLTIGQGFFSSCALQMMVYGGHLHASYKAACVVQKVVSEQNFYQFFLS